MSNIIPFRQRPQAIVERLGRDYDEKPVYAAIYVDEEGGRVTDYVGPDYIDAMLSANEWLDGETQLLDRVPRGGGGH